MPTITTSEITALCMQLCTFTTIIYSQTACTWWFQHFNTKEHTNFYKLTL